MSERTRAALRDMHFHEPPARILRRPEVERRTGLSRSAIYAEMSRGRFPAAISLTAKAVGWLESSIETWIAERASVAKG